MHEFVVIFIFAVLIYLIFFIVSIFLNKKFKKTKDKLEITFKNLNNDQLLLKQKKIKFIIVFLFFLRYFGFIPIIIFIFIINFFKSIEIEYILYITGGIYFIIMLSSIFISPYFNNQDILIDKIIKNKT